MDSRDLLMKDKATPIEWDRGLTHRVISDSVHRLLVTLSYFRPDRFVQLLSLTPILILLLNILVLIDLEYTDFVTIRSLGESN